MAKQFWKNPRPLVFALAAMTFLCAVLLILYGFARRENTLLQTTRSEQFLSLAAGEAEAAAAAWQNGSPKAEVYHRIASAADYLSMAAPAEKNNDLIDTLRNAGKILLEGEELSPEAAESLRTLAGGIGMLTDEEPDAVPASVSAESDITDLFSELPVFSRREGLKIAETMTETKNTLHPAAGEYYIYTCRNVYVKLSQKGGVPLEAAVYTPAVNSPSYERNTCAFRSRRFLEEFMPRFLQEKEPAKTGETEILYRFFYPCSGGQIRVDVRKDTGRITGLQILGKDEKEQPLSREKDCSYIVY